MLIIWFKIWNDVLFRGFSLVQGCQRPVVYHSFKLVISFYLVVSGFLLTKCQWFAMGLLLPGYLLAQSTKFEVHMWHLQGLSKHRGMCIIFSSITKVSTFYFLKNLFLPMESKRRSNLSQYSEVFEASGLLCLGLKPKMTLWTFSFVMPSVWGYTTLSSMGMLFPLSPMKM